jgi:hypothetical protein
MTIIRPPETIRELYQSCIDLSRQHAHQAEIVRAYASEIHGLDLDDPEADRPISGAERSAILDRFPDI